MDTFYRTAQHMHDYLIFRAEELGVLHNPNHTVGAIHECLIERDFWTLLPDGVMGLSCAVAKLPVVLAICPPRMS